MALCNVSLSTAERRLLAALAHDPALALGLVDRRRSQRLVRRGLLDGGTLRPTVRGRLALGDASAVGPELRLVPGVGPAPGYPGRAA